MIHWVYLFILAVVLVRFYLMTEMLNIFLKVILKHYLHQSTSHTQGVKFLFLPICTEVCTSV